MDHTPGPWTVDNLHIAGGNYIGDEIIIKCDKILGANGEDVVICDGGYYPPHNGDIFLISSAPELLDVLEKIVHADVEIGEELYEIANNAIRKARGR